MNTPALLCIFKALRDPSLCLPHATIPHLSHLPLPVSHAFTHIQSSRTSHEKDLAADIKAVVLDKDNCFALPHTSTIDPSCTAIVARLKTAYPPNALLIVSNTAGYTRRDPDLAQARALHAATGIAVLTHAQPKPHAQCGEDILRWFRERGVVDRADQIAVVGDRLFTDVMLAKNMGAWGIWVREGVRRDMGLWTRGELAIEGWLSGRGWSAKRP